MYVVIWNKHSVTHLNRFITRTLADLFADELREDDDVETIRIEKEERA